MAFDVLSFVMGQKAAGGSGGSSGGGEVKFVRKEAYFESTTIGQRVSVDFGFVPDFILFMKGVNSTTTSQNSLNGLFCAWGYSSKFYEKFGVELSTRFYKFTPSSKIMYQDGSAYPIDTDKDFNAIYNADETGFNVGKQWSAGDYQIHAFSFG